MLVYNRLVWSKQRDPVAARRRFGLTKPNFEGVRKIDVNGISRPVVSILPSGNEKVDPWREKIASAIPYHLETKDPTERVDDDEKSRPLPKMVGRLA